MHAHNITLPIVTIGIPAVKSSFLRQSINSAIRQTYAQLEIIILNNAKGIEKEVIRELVASFSDNRIRYYENIEQLPMVNNWNYLLGLVNGSLFTLLCDDDYFDKEYIQEMYNLSVKYPFCSVFHSRILFTTESDEVSKLSPLCNDWEDLYDFVYHRIINFREQFLSDFTVRTNAIKKIGGFANVPDGWGSDDMTWFKIAEEGGVAYCSKPLFYYRINTINTTNSKKIKRKLEAIRIYYNFIQSVTAVSSSDDRLLTLKKSMINTKLYDLKTNLYVAVYVIKFRGMGIPAFCIKLILGSYVAFKKIVQKN